MRDTMLDVRLHMVAVVAALGCGSTRPGGGEPHGTYEVADVGVYSGGWHGGPLDAATGAGGAEPCAAGTGCGRVTYTGTYCGGPAPLQEMLDDLAVPRPLDHTEFIVRPGETYDPALPQTARVATDAAGRFSFAAAPGAYCLVTIPKADFLGPQGDPAVGEAIPVPSFGSGVAECMDQWARSCDGVVTVTDAPRAPVEFNIVRGCAENPCLPPPAYP